MSHLVEAVLVHLLKEHAAMKEEIAALRAAVERAEVAAQARVQRPVVDPEDQAAVAELRQRIEALTAILG